MGEGNKGTDSGARVPRADPRLCLLLAVSVMCVCGKLLNFMALQFAKTGVVITVADDWFKTNLLFYLRG